MSAAIFSITGLLAQALACQEGPIGAKFRPMGLGTLRLSCLTLVSVCFFACGKDESGGGSDDDDDTPTVTTNTATSSSTTTPNTNTNTNASTSTTGLPNSSTTPGPQTTTGNPVGSGGTGGTGGTTSVGGSAGEQGNVGGSAGAPGGSGGSVVIEDDCEYEACGGDLADTDWSYSRLCVERDALLAGIQAICENVELISSTGEVTGTIGFGTDTYDQDASFSITAEFQVPEDCNPLGCALTQAALGSVGGFSDASCTDSDDGGCVCSGTLEGTNEASGSDYATDGDNLTLDEAEGTYCASGDSFKYTGVIQDVEFVYETVPQ